MNKKTEKNSNIKKDFKENPQSESKKNSKINISKSIDEKDKMIADLKVKLKEAEDKLLRELAENENLRKRHEKETQDNYKYAIKNFSYDLLNVTDNLQRALISVPKDNEETPILKNLVIGLQAV